MCQIENWVIFLLLVMCSISDFKKKTMPAVLLIVLSITVLGFAIFGDSVGVRLRVGGAILGMLFLLISKCTKEAIGYGDSWLILLLGIQLGYLEAISVLFAASLLAGVASLFFLWKCNWKRDTSLPFVPFLSVSYLGAMLL